MLNSLKIVCSVGAVGILAAMMVAQEPGKAEGKKMARAGILHPEMKPEAGTYKAPAAKLGEKTPAPWSQTTIDAAVDKKPEPGRLVTRVGEIVDFSCYLQLGKHGDKHRSCGQKCVNNGQPIGLLTANGTLYMLMPEEHDPRRDGGVDFRPAAAEHMAHIVEVTGTETSHNGYRAIYVSGFTK